MKRSRHPFRDVIILSSPVLLLLGYLLSSSIASFHNAEIRNFHGYLARGLRVGTFRQMLQYSCGRLLNRSQRRFLENNSTAEPALPQVDLRVRGSVLDALAENIPASARVWQEGSLVFGNRFQDVEVRHRGQRLDNYFFQRKSWKLKTDKYELVGGQRTLNYTALQGRLDNHMTFLVAAAVGLPAPRSWVVRLFLNMESQGLYLQEEQIDESLIRRYRRMPGDIFYGELFIPDEPKMSSDDLFSNPFLWEKKARFNKYPDEYRPYLTEMLDHIADPDPGSWDRLFEVLDREWFALHFALIAFQGDQHIDHSHNHKYYFNPLRGRFEPLVWNARLNMPRGRGVESMANRLYRKACQDPRFLDEVQRRVADDFVAADMTQRQLDELQGLRTALASKLSPQGGLRWYLGRMAEIVKDRSLTVQRHLKVAKVCFEQQHADGVCRLRLHAKAAASLRLRGLQLKQPVPDLQVYEDRDQDGVVSAADRLLAVQVQGEAARLRDDEALLYVGRDFRAPYHDASAQGSFATHRMYTRLAYLPSTYLLVNPAGGAAPEVVKPMLERTVGSGPIAMQAGPADDYVAEESVHPWQMPARPEAREFHFEGVVEIREDLLLTERDSLSCAPGTELRLGPGVSILAKSPVHWQRVKVRPLDPDQPWGVGAVQDPGASGSSFVDCDLEGGSEDTLFHVYYSGMFSVHYAADVRVEGSRFAHNVLGDDTVRFACCDNLILRDVVVEGANGDGIDCDLSTGSIVDTRVLQPHNDGIDLMTAVVHLTGVQVEGSGDKGISLGESADPEVRDCSLVGCNIGIAIKDASDPRIFDTEVRGCQVGIGSYDKNWRYPGGGRGHMQGCRLLDNVVDVQLDASSQLILENCQTTGRFVLPPGRENSLEIVGAESMP